MKKILAAAIVVATTAAATSAGATISTPSGLYLWRGDVIITSNTNPNGYPNLCNSLGDSLGKTAQVIFAPKGAPNDPNKDMFMIFTSGDLAARYWVSNSSGGLLDKAKSVASTSIDRTGFSSNNTIKGTFSFPAPPTPTVVGSTTAAVSWTINDTDSNTGQTCTFTAQGKLLGPF